MNEIELSEEQKACIDKIRIEYELGETKLSILGPAGSGKSTMIPFLIEALELDANEDVAYLAPTGKASVVMRLKGMPAQTLHSFIYNTFFSKEHNRYFTTEKTLDQLDPYPRLIIVDEIAMCSVKDLKVLEKHNIPIIAFGDNAQLPPINSEDNHYVQKPTFVLKEIHRQAESSEIIQFSKRIRETGYYALRYGEDGEVMSIPLKDLSTSMLSWADQILTPTNAVKDNINRVMREKMNFSKEYPEVGDKIICLRNEWDIHSDKSFPLTNGTIGYITNIQYEDLFTFAPYAMVKMVPEFDEEDEFFFKMDLAPYMGMTPFMSSAEDTRVSTDFGYAITIHKAQGSEWNKVLVVADGFFGDKGRMAYTAATRAKERLVWVQ